MNSNWDEMRRAKEDAYFDKQNEEALSRIRQRKNSEPRLCPISGDMMEEIIISGVVIDRCPICGGIWLDAGELETIVKEAKEGEKERPNFLPNIFTSLFGGKKNSE